jgi:hypothetical protein
MLRGRRHEKSPEGRSKENGAGSRQILNRK